MTKHLPLWSTLLHRLSLLRNIVHSAQSASPQEAYRDIETPFTLISCADFKSSNQQLLLLTFFATLRQHTTVPIKLTLIGYRKDTLYWKQLQQRIDDLALSDCVELTLLSSAQLLAPLYRQADLYLCVAQYHLNRALLDSILQYLPIVNLHKASIFSLSSYPLALLTQIINGQDEGEWAQEMSNLLQNPRKRRAIAYAHYQQLGELYRQQPRWLSKLTLLLRHYSSTEQYQAAQGQSLAYRIEGPFDSSYSLALVNRELAVALEQLQPNKVGLYATEGPGDYPPDIEFLSQHPALAQLHQSALQTPRTDCTLRLLYPPRVSNMQGRFNGISCYGWEESSFPQTYVTQFNLYLDFATTMSRYVTRLLQDNGVTCPLFTAGVGVDHILKHPVDASTLPPLPNRCLKLLHISSCFPRKGVDVLLQAYGQQFDDRDNVCLIIKTFANPHHDIAQQLALWQGSLSNAPTVTLINQDLDESAIRALYQAADALVAPSRGEGFGLPVAEAMLHQLPVITTGYGGQTDFSCERTAWLIDYQFARAKSHMQQANSVWAEPDARHLASILGSFYGAYCQGTLTDFTADRVARAAQQIQFNTWERVALRTEQALRTVKALPLDIPAPKLAVVTTWHRKCGIATYSELLLQHAFPDSLILANQDAQLTQNDDNRVTRCWQEGVEDDLQQLEHCIIEQGVNQVLIQFNFSFFSLSALQRLMQSLLDKQIQVLLALHSTADVYWGEELKTLRDLQPALGNIQRIFVHSVADLNRLKSFALVDNVSLFPHGVQRIDSAETPATLKTDLFERVSDAIQGKTVIASYGFLLPHKGISQLIEAFSQLLLTQPDSHLLLVTAQYPAVISQEYLRHCQTVIVQYKLDEKITLVSDYLSDHDSRAWLSLADVIVYPYQQTQESSSAAVRWGLALEKPVLCTPLDIFEDVASAVHWLPGISPAQIAQGLSDALTNPQLLAKNFSAQQAWLAEHDWQSLSLRLKNQLIALNLSQFIADKKP
jgi:glycosyltransferase involved in cell wall biosynthesis